MREGIPLPADANLILAKKKARYLYPCTTEPVYIMVAQIILLGGWFSIMYYSVGGCLTQWLYTMHCGK